MYQYGNVTVTSVRSVTLVNAYPNSVQTGNQFQRNFIFLYCHSNRWKWLSVMWLGPSATLPQCGAPSPPSWRRSVAVLCIYTPLGMRCFNSQLPTHPFGFDRDVESSVGLHINVLQIVTIVCWTVLLLI